MITDIMKMNEIVKYGILDQKAKFTIFMKIGQKL